MKNIQKLLIVAVLFFAGFADVQAQSETEKFFVGKWKLMVYGLPNGDTEMVLNITKNSDGSLGGTIGGDDANANKLTKAEIEGNTFYANFIGNGYNVPLYIEKKGDKKVEGSMNDMFDIEGTKIK
jgi:hypothetical protein